MALTTGRVVYSPAGLDFGIELDLDLDDPALDLTNKKDWTHPDDEDWDVPKFTADDLRVSASDFVLNDSDE